ncbi:MAG TPA: DUF3040 domain-containing protein [Mycobacteriales bacterium]|nr:DUF3040 domain-containing protein [Mycobacteriales bacterium]HVX69301.1 DUF3040 domain-containing protein [Mycobacteriales bacterium]
MPLSDHEQRLLEQIEQALYADDPKFARLYRSADVRSHYRGRVVRAVLGVVAGTAMLLAGVIVPLIALGVAGFVVMLASVTYGIASWQRMTGHRLAPASDSPRPRRRSDREPRTRAPRVHGERRSFMQRLEDRWQRRQDGDG